MVAMTLHVWEHLFSILMVYYWEVTVGLELIGVDAKI